MTDKKAEYDEQGNWIGDGSISREERREMLEEIYTRTLELSGIDPEAMAAELMRGFDEAMDDQPRPEPMTLEKLAQQMTEGFGRVEARIDGIEARLERIEGTVGRIEERMESILQTVTQTNDALTQIKRAAPGEPLQ